jgi:hypothetical protein
MADVKDKVVTDKTEKMLGAFVDEDLFWKFKKAAADRKEKMSEAIANAAYLYLDIDKNKEAESNDK